MKFSKIILSVNLAAAIPLAAQTAGQAQGPAISDKAQWLKDSLATVQKTKGLSATAGLLPEAKETTLCKSQDPLDCLTKSSDLACCRPFVKERRLPSEKDLSHALVSQAPRLAISPASTLSGSVSTYSVPAMPSFLSTKTTESTSKPSFVPKLAIPKFSQSPSQVADRLVNAHNQLPKVKSGLDQSPTTAGNTGMPESTPLAPPSLISSHSGFALMRQAEQELFVPSEPEALTRQDLAIVDRYAESQDADSAPLSNSGSAGPPPFPLNLLPEASIKQLMRGMANPGKSAVRGASFGAWGRGQRAAQSYCTRALPLGSFQSHIHTTRFIARNGFRNGWALKGSGYAHAPRFRARTIPRSYYPSTSTLRLPVKYNYVYSPQLLAATRRSPSAFTYAMYPPYASPARLY